MNYVKKRTILKYNYSGKVYNKIEEQNSVASNTPNLEENITEPIDKIDQFEIKTILKFYIKEQIHRWLIEVHLIINQQYIIDIRALDTDMNYVRGLIPTRYYEKFIERLSSANHYRLKINYKISNVHICMIILA